jgi:putative membrane protein
MRKTSILLAMAAIAIVPATRAQAPALSVSAPVRASVAPALDDPTIVAIFDAANSWDIQTSEIAMKKSHNKDVRRFAKMMIHDHTAVRQMGRDLAKKLAVTPTPPGPDFPLAVDHVATLKKLRSTRGHAFDKAYIDHEVWYHQAVIDAVTNQLLPATKNAELKALEVKVAPNFQAHLAAAKDVQAKIEK